jgi:hypothetical protein
MKEREARAKYSQHKKNVARRGIAWTWTFPLWRQWWTHGGRWERRGLGADCLVMALRDPLGPCGPGNVRCMTRAEHSAHVNLRTYSSLAARARMAEIGRARGGEQIERMSDPCRNPMNRPCQTPSGRFRSRAEAAAAMGVSRTIILRRLRQGRAGYLDLAPPTPGSP